MSDANILISEHPLHTGTPFGAIVLAVSYIKSYEILLYYSDLQDKDQVGHNRNFMDNTLNIRKISTLMDEGDMTIFELSNKTHIAIDVLHDIFTRKANDTCLRNALLIAKALDVSVDEISNIP